MSYEEDETIVELRRLLAASTPGEWRHEGGHIWCQPTGRRVDLDLALFDVDGYRDVQGNRSLAESEANAALVAAMHNALPRLLYLASRTLWRRARLAEMRGAPKQLTTTKDEGG